MTGRVQPVEFEVFKHLFLSIADEMGVTLRQTAFSPNIKERLDYSCAVYDRGGQTIAQGDHMPVHLGAMPLSVHAAIAAGPMESGDVVMVNDPFQGGTHLPDITLVSPVFLTGDRRPTFYVANRAHHSDVGGMSPGSMPVATEIFQEGLILPPVRLVKRGHVVSDVLAIVLANVRTPEERRGDLAAQVAANRVAESRLRTAAERYDREHLLAFARALQDHTERAVRAALREVPDGRYTFEDALDDDGVVNRPVKIAAAVTVSRGKHRDRLHGIRSTGRRKREREFRDHMVRLPLRAALPDSGRRALQRRPFATADRDGAARHHCECQSAGRCRRRKRRGLAAHHRRGLRRAGPCAPRPDTGGQPGHDEQRDVRRNGPAYGPPLRRITRRLAEVWARDTGLDGLSAVHTHMSNTRNTPVEAIEHDLPIRVIGYHVRRGSGGAGRFRGGDGLVREYEMLAETTVTVLSDRRRGAPYGARGGHPGARGRNVLIRAGHEEELPGKVGASIAAW